MGGSWDRIGGVVLLVALAGCHSPRDKLDLRENPDLYRSPGYTARIPVDRGVFVAPLVDERRDDVVDAAGPNPTQWMPDSRWARSPVAMIEDILRDELADSRVFVQVQRTPPPDAKTLVLRPYLTAARVGAQEHTAGRRSIADLGLRIVVYGPDEGHGRRAIVFDRPFRETTQSEVQSRPPSAPGLLGLALRQAMANVLAALDQSNVSRSGVPIDAVDEPRR